MMPQGVDYKKLWGIRHLRYFWLRRQMMRWWRCYPGPKTGISKQDWRHLDDIWKGKR